MTLFDIVLKGLNRQVSKKIMISTVIILCAAAVITLYSYSQTQRSTLEKDYDEYGANIVITPRTEGLSLSYGGVRLDGIVTRLNRIPEEEIEAIRTISLKENIRAVSPKHISVGDISAGDLKTQAMVLGVDPQSEMQTKSWWGVEGSLPETPRSVLLGSDAALNLGLKAGDMVNIQGYEFAVSGILQATGSQDDDALFISIPGAREVYGSSFGYSLVEVSALCSECPIDDIVAEISSVMPSADVKVIRQMMDQRMKTLARMEKFMLGLQALLIILCALIITSSISASVQERAHEIAVFRSIGFQESGIMFLILAEVVLISFAAGIAALAVSFAFLRFAFPAILGIEPGMVWMHPGLFAYSLAAIIAVSALSAMGPARKAARLDPVKILSSV